MKRFLIILLILAVSAFIALRVIRNQVRHDLLQPVAQPALAPSPTIVIDQLKKTNTALFVPSWTAETIIDTSYDHFIYFGISPTREGIDTSTTGKTLSDFLKAAPVGKDTFLTLQMQDTDINAAVLQNKTLQQKVISQTIDIAKENDFSGIVLDLEMGGIPFSALIDEVNNFTKALNTQAKAKQLQFDVTLYGDT